MQEVDSERNEFKRGIDNELTNLRVTYTTKVTEAENRENRYRRDLPFTLYLSFVLFLSTHKNRLSEVTGNLRKEIDGLRVQVSILN
jgi:hypothetical protein